MWFLGEVAEWLKAQHWKCCIGATLSRVRIPRSPLLRSVRAGFFLPFSRLESPSRPCSGPAGRSAETTRNVVLGGLLLGGVEDLVGVVEFHEVTHLSGSPFNGFGVVKGGHVADANGLLHVVGDDHDGEALFELMHRLLDLQR